MPQLVGMGETHHEAHENLLKLLNDRGLVPVSGKTWVEGIDGVGEVQLAVSVFAKEPELEVPDGDS